MAALKMGVYTPGLELVGLLESFKSLIFQEQAFAAGSFTVDCSMTPTVRRLLVKENIIWFQEETAGIIEYIFQRQDEAGPYITAKGRLLSGILDRRILWGRYDMSGTPQSIMCRMVDACAVTPTDPARVIPGLTIEPPAEGGPNIRKQKTGGTLLETLSELGETYNVAFGVRLDPGGRRWSSGPARALTGLCPRAKMTLCSFPLSLTTCWRANIHMTAAATAT